MCLVADGDKLQAVERRVSKKNALLKIVKQGIKGELHEISVGKACERGKIRKLEVKQITHFAFTAEITVNQRDARVRVV